MGVVGDGRGIRSTDYSVKAARRGRVSRVHLSTRGEGECVVSKASVDLDHTTLKLCILGPFRRLLVGPPATSARFGRPARRGRPKFLPLRHPRGRARQKLCFSSTTCGSPANALRTWLLDDIETISAATHRAPVLLLTESGEQRRQALHPLTLPLVATAFPLAGLALGAEQSAADM